MPAAAAAVRTSGLALSPQPDGTLRLRADEVEARQLGLGGGALSTRFGRIAARGVTASLRPHEGAWRLAEAAVDELTLEDGRLVLDGPPSALPLAAAARQGWRLDALGMLNGTLHGYITDAAWIVDADVRVPIAGGSVDFNRVEVAHVGPDSSMGVSHMGLYVDAPNGRQYLFLFAGSHVPGVRFERRGLLGARVADRGALDLRAFLEGVLRHLGGAPLGRAPHQVGAQLDRTRLSGELQLGDGALGAERAHLVLDGRAEGRNTVKLAAAAVSRHLQADVPALSAAAASLELPALEVRTGAAAGALRIEAENLGSPDGPAIRVEVASLTLHTVRVGPRSAA